MNDEKHVARQLFLAFEADLNSDYDTSIKHFESAAQANSTESYIANIHLGWTHLHYGKSELAIPPFKKALLSKPGLIMANLGLGHAYVELEDIRSAKAHYQVAFPQKLYSGGSIDNHETNVWTSYFARCGKMLLPLPYLAHSIFSLFNDIVNRLFAVSVLNFPYYYFLFLAKNKRFNVNKSSFIKNTLTTQIPFANNYCTPLIPSSYQEAHDQSEALVIIFSDFDVLLHERIFHFFDVIMCRMCFGTIEAEAHAVFVTASRICNEGFAYWLQVRGLESHNKKVPANASIDIELPDRVFESPEHPYSVGLKAFLDIEKQRGIEHAFLSYFIAYDFEECCLESLSKISLISLFKKTKCNPSARLKVLAQIEITLTGNLHEDLQNTYKSLEDSLNELNELNEHCTIGGAIK